MVPNTIILEYSLKDNLVPGARKNLINLETLQKIELRSSFSKVHLKLGFEAVSDRESGLWLIFENCAPAKVAVITNSNFDFLIVAMLEVGKV